MRSSRSLPHERYRAQERFGDLEWDFGLYDAQSGEEVSVAGVLLADRPLGREESIDGDAVLVTLRDQVLEYLNLLSP